MTLNNRYHQNKPLFYAILNGVFYFFLHWSMDFGAASQGFLVTMMMFMPGITFPLITSYFKSGNHNIATPKYIIHFVLSLVVYLIVSFVVYLDTQNALIIFSSMFAGFLGSFLFLLLTKYLLKKATYAFANCHHVGVKRTRTHTLLVLRERRHLSGD
jgi:hypothetical protein